jgi:hypothetical protein
MYVDPGYGVLILQSLFAAVVGVFFIARRKVSSLVRSLTAWMARDNPATGSGKSD